ncbi:hypothetical protein DS884_11200 [Tenacibaculum sp. E3R01]|uniref:hypothetical protein n=1 Tax=Tenacibaculum sp. E3R01 TaxID=2267227 RepID=UPI000DEBD8DF|nr:hypothetical protein [Tenacibaculum sp. E3R01]RBW57145.1 hypothetical protein DS884_11200 [Tenacibaculum sp. E3R01]
MKKILFSFLTLLGINVGGKAQTMEKLGVGLKKTIELTSKKFERKNHAFLINVAKDNVVVIQLIHGILIPMSLGKSINEIKNSDRIFNFSLNLPFNDYEKNKLEKFENLDVFEKFKHYDANGTPCYSINFGTNQQEAKRITLEIIQKVYSYKLNDTFEFEIYDQGKF